MVKKLGLFQSHDTLNVAVLKFYGKKVNKYIEIFML